MARAPAGGGVPCRRAAASPGAKGGARPPRRRSVPGARLQLWCVCLEDCRCPADSPGVGGGPGATLGKGDRGDEGFPGATGSDVGRRRDLPGDGSWGLALHVAAMSGCSHADLDRVDVVPCAMWPTQQGRVDWVRGVCRPSRLGIASPLRRRSGASGALVSTANATHRGIESRQGLPGRNPGGGRHNIHGR